jgi:predicted DsbA family dithiol-disulfide isomerase
VEARCWSDYLCPWCYVGQARSDLMERLGVSVVHLPYELHPEIGPAGRRIRPDGRLAPTFERVAAACVEAGLPWRAPDRMPNTRRALETAEWVRREHPEAAAALHRAIFAAHFAQGLAIDDPTVLDRLVAESGAPAAAVRAAVDDGRAAGHVDASMDEARGLGVASTPTWVLDDGFAVPGALDEPTLARWISKIVARRTRDSSAAEPVS